MRIRYFPIGRIGALVVLTMTLPLTNIGNSHTSILVLLSGPARDAGEKSQKNVLSDDAALREE